MAYDFTGKVVLVTGGARGIGLNCVKELLRNGVQAITVVDINSTQGNNTIKELTEEFGADRVIFMQADVTKSDQLEAAFKVTRDKWKALDIVINSAGILNDRDWEREISINCGGMVCATVMAFQYMGKDRGGKGGIIVNIASNLSLQPLSSIPVYVGTKHFIVGFNRSLGTPYHYNRSGIKVLTMCPGSTDTPLNLEACKFPFTSLDPNIQPLLKAELSAAPMQPVEIVGKSVIDVITKGDNGSVWLVENNEPAYQVIIPDRHTLRKE